MVFYQANCLIYFLKVLPIHSSINDRGQSFPAESPNFTYNDLNFEILILLILVLVVQLFSRLLFELNHKHRRDYYRNDYLKSDTWNKKCYVVFKRDNWRCVYCGARVTEVHHKKYAKSNIGKEPIKWLMSVCRHVMTPFIIRQ